MLWSKCLNVLYIICELLKRVSCATSLRLRCNKFTGRQIVSKYELNYKLYSQEKNVFKLEFKLKVMTLHFKPQINF